MRRFYILALIGFVLMGCEMRNTDNSGNTRQGASDGSADAGNPATIVDGWSTEKDSNGNFADLTINRMTPAERERVRSEVTQNGVIWINSKTGYTLYKIIGSERFDKIAFVVPKVLVIGSVDGGRASLRELPNGKVALTVPVALVDGSQSELPYATTRITVPSGLVLDDSKRALIQKELKEQFGHDHELANMGSCPKKIVIKIAGVDHDVTPKVFGSPNGPTGCQPNQPFTVTLSGLRKYMERFLSEDVFNGAAEMAAMYEVAGTYVDEVRWYQFKTSHIYTGLKERLTKKGEKPEDARVKVSIDESEADSLLAPYVQQAMSRWAARERFFDRVKNTAIAQMKLVFFDETVVDKAKRLVIKDDSNFKPYDVPVRVVNETIGREGELFYSSSILKPILNATDISIQGEPRQPTAIAGPENGISQNVFTVKEGDEYELQLQSLLIHQYEYDDDRVIPKIEDRGLKCRDKLGDLVPACRRYKNECVKYQTFCKRAKLGCVRYGTKLDCNTEFNVTPVGCITAGLFGNCGISRSCSNVPDPSICAEFGEVGCEEPAQYCREHQQSCEEGEDEPICVHQDTDLTITTHFSAPAPVILHRVNAPLAKTDQDIVKGLVLRFNWADGSTVDCPLLSLIKDVSGQSVRFKTKNTSGCTPFPEGYSGQPLLAIVNKISTERRNVPCGVMNFNTLFGTKYYGCKGYTAEDITPDLHKPGEAEAMRSFSRTPLTISYYPVVDLNAILISRSSGFGSGDSVEGRLESIKDFRK